MLLDDGGAGGWLGWVGEEITCRGGRSGQRAAGVVAGPWRVGMARVAGLLWAAAGGGRLACGEEW